jgi:hypothetical protein
MPSRMICIGQDVGQTDERTVLRLLNLMGLKAISGHRLW